MDLELELCTEASGGKADKADRGTGPGAPVIIAKLAVHQLSSLPVDHDTKNNNTLLIAGMFILEYFYATSFLFEIVIGLNI